MFPSNIRQKYFVTILERISLKKKKKMKANEENFNKRKATITYQSDDR